MKIHPELLRALIVECRVHATKKGEPREIPSVVFASAANAIEHLLDAEPVLFYGSEFYCLSNFSAFNLHWKDAHFDTSEAAYHWEKFKGYADDVATRIRYACSAHEAFKIAESNKEKRRPDWDEIKVAVMREIVKAKWQQHAYVRKKLAQTGTRQIIEDSPRDDFWGWGPNRDGKNMLGRIWMELRDHA